MCQNQEGKDKIGRLETAQKCAIKAEVPWSVLRDCAGPDADGIDAEGAQLLLQSVEATIEQGVGCVTGSSTVKVYSDSAVE